jgi:hypothetical protein
VSELIDQHGFEPAIEHDFDRALPAGVDLQGFAESFAVAKSQALQPILHRAAGVAERRVLQRLQRTEAAAHVLQISARAAQGRMRRALPLQGGFCGAATFFQ